jgi:hypothetical protein
MLKVSVAALTLHSALNLLWLVISVCVFAWFLRGERGQRTSQPWRRLLAVCALCITLFPSVSDTDDIFTFSLMPVPGHRPGGVGSAPAPEESREKGTLQLARLLESLDHYQVTAFYSVVLTLFCVALSALPLLRCETRSVLRHAGRAPPAA